MSARSSDLSQALLLLMVWLPWLLLALCTRCVVWSPRLTPPSLIPRPPFSTGNETRLLQYIIFCCASCPHSSWLSHIEGAVLGQEWGERCQHLARVLSIGVQSGFPVYFTQLEQVRGPSLSLPPSFFSLFLPPSSLFSTSLLLFSSLSILTAILSCSISSPPPRFLAHVKHTD